MGPASVQFNWPGRVPHWPAVEQLSESMTEVWAFAAVPLLFCPISTGFAAVPRKKVAPKGELLMNDFMSAPSLKTPAPARTTVLPLP